MADCVEATVEALEAPVGEIYNVGGGETATVWEILGKLERIIGQLPVVRREVARAGDQRYTFADTAKLTKALGWKPRIGLDEGLAQQVVWQRQEGNRLVA